MIDIDLIAGARPNFIKIAAIYHSIVQYNRSAEKPLLFRIIHTGQHFDKNMSGDFFEQLGLPAPDFNFEVGSGSQASQKAQIMIAYEKLLLDQPCKICVVVGDVNSTAACSIAAVKLGIRVAHVEAGIRSYDRSMPEEINRLITDSISDYFFTTTELASGNLVSSGHSKDSIFHVGNTMIDTLFRFKDDFIRNEEVFSKIAGSPYLLLTMHRPSNVDSLERFDSLVSVISTTVPGSFKIVFPVHPRTKRAAEIIQSKYPNIILTDPQPYLSFMYLLQNSKGIITDSGGVTEESTVLGVPCITLRNTTERPETVSEGTNVLVGDDMQLLKVLICDLCEGSWKESRIPILWDGFTGDRIVTILARLTNLNVYST